MKYNIFMKKYCTNCGSATDFSFVKPKFCSNCGSNFDNLNFQSISKLSPSQVEITSTKPKNPNIYKKSIDLNIENIDDDYEDGIDVRSVPNINNLVYEYQSTKKDSLKFKDIINNPNNPEASPKRERAKKRRMSKKDVQNILEEFKNEAKAIRSKK